MGAINWQKSASHIDRLVRGLLPWPTAYTFYQGKMLKILSSEVIKGKPTQPPGTMTAIHKNGFVIASGEESLLVQKVHLEAAKPMEASIFVNGHRLEVGFKFN